jgi:hypothetical protein
MNHRAQGGIALEKERLDVERERRTSSVRHLQNLYSIGVTVALGFAFERTIASESKERAIPLLIAFILTLLPFYHGTVRHLDDAYIFRRVNRNEAILAESLARFLEACLFFGLAASVDKPIFFAWMYVTLLIVNIGWSWLTEVACVKPERRLSAPHDWRDVNLVTVAIAISCLTALHTFRLASNESVLLEVGLVVVTFARTTADYRKSWGFYAALEDEREMAEERRSGPSLETAPSLA